MAVTKAVTPAIAKLGQVVTYTIAIQSIGEAIASGVIMTDPLPSGVIFRDWVEKGLGTLVVPLRMVKWGPADVAAGATYAISFTAEVTSSTGFAGSTVTNVAYVSAANADPDTDPASFVIEGGPLSTCQWCSETTNHDCSADVTAPWFVEDQGAGHCQASATNGIGNRNTEKPLVLIARPTLNSPHLPLASCTARR